jgi:hypothetical protein
VNEKITLDDLLTMGNRQVAEVFFRGSPIAPGSLDNTQYLGIDLSLPPFMNKILWKTFRKTFYRDPKTGVLRGWNVRMEQTGWEKPGTPMMKNGKPVTFGHYHLLPAKGKKFPKNWQGADYLDYAVAGNPVYDPARYTYSPLVAVNAGSSALLLGWEVFRVAGMPLAIPDFWALKREGAIENVIPPPDET